MAEKPTDEFNRNFAKLDGLQNMCRSCQKDYKARWYEEHRDEQIAYKKLYNSQNGHLRVALYEKNREVELERSRVWAKENPERRQANEAKRRAAKKATSVEYIHPLVVLEIHDGVCGICDQDVDPFCFEIDHRIPLALGGPHIYENVQPAHPRCNRSKGAKVGVLA